MDLISGGGQDGDVSFDDALLSRPEIAAVLDRDAVRALTDPANYLGAAPEMTLGLLARRSSG